MFKLAALGSLVLASVPIQGPMQVRSWEKPVAPGVLYRMEADFTKPLTLHAIRWRPGAGGVKLMTALGGGSVFGYGGVPSRESVSDMAQRTHAIAGVNGDFFPASGDPLGLMISKGELVSRPWPGRTFAAWGPRGLVFGRGGFQGEASGPRGFHAVLAGLNEEAPANGVVLNRPLAGSVTLKEKGVHVILELSGTLGPITAASGRVVRLVEDKDLVLGSGETALSGYGTAADELLKLKPDDQVALSIKTTGADLSDVTEAIAGGPQIVRGGRVSVEAAEEKFRAGFDTERHPRTALGTTPSGEVWLAVVDGRQPRVSRGATLAEMGEIMIRLGCTEAMNLDGGGSSEMAALGVVLNRPSDGQPRPVANGVFLYGAMPPAAEGSMVIVGKNYLVKDFYSQYQVVDERGRAIANEEVLWSAEGPGWIDQGGYLRWIGPGDVKVMAAVRGRVLSTRVVADSTSEAAAPAGPPKTSPD